MTAPDHLRITGPEDILGFIPHSLGYWPENSLVAMTLQGKRLGATLRVDLPEPGGGSGRSDMLAGFARNVVTYLQADDAADGSLLAFAFLINDPKNEFGARVWLDRVTAAISTCGCR